jgi:anti-sigma factor RsiW
MKPDELIMLLHDGELSEREAEEVRALLERDASATALFEQLDWVGSALRESANQASASVDLADAVMARIEQEPVVLDAKRARVKPRSPARTLGLVSGALALAAGLAVMVTRGPRPGSVAQKGQVAAPIAAVSSPEVQPPEQSVAVERVDFGGSQGAVFMVPGSDDRTLVIWTLDDAPIWTHDDVPADEGPEVDL